MFMMKKKRIMNEKWDYLIVLDACRFDYFQQVYKEYFQGELEEIGSTGAATPEWCVNTFQKKYNDIIYISANPHINSKTTIWNGKWAAKDHFFRIIDVWKWGWDEDLRTVPPKEVNKAFTIYKDKYPEKRFIIHYMQPHAPYLHYQPKYQFKQPIVNRNTTKNKDKFEKFRKKILFLSKRANLHLATSLGIHIRKFTWKLNELLRFPPVNRMDAVRREIRDNGLRQAYADNLKTVLRHVANLANNLSGNIYITSDHGEYLGESGDYGHLAQLYDPILLEVPWFKVKTVKKVDTKEQIREKIREMDFQAHTQ